MKSTIALAFTLVVSCASAAPFCPELDAARHASARAYRDTLEACQWDRAHSPKARQSHAR
jgi:hypothetical protein